MTHSMREDEQHPGLLPGWPGETGASGGAGHQRCRIDVDWIVDALWGIGAERGAGLTSRRPHPGAARSRAGVWAGDKHRGNLLAATPHPPGPAVGHVSPT
jgi:hypothetical protein